MSLSEMFGDRILGGKPRVQMPEEVNIQKPQLDLDIGSLKSESTVFDELKISEMVNKKDKIFDFINLKPEGMKTQTLKEKSFTMKMKSNDMFSNKKMPKGLNMKAKSLFGGTKPLKEFSMKTNTLFGNTKLPKGLNMNIKSKMLFGDTKLPKGYNMDKLKTNLFTVENNALGHIVRRPDNIGFNRVMNQGKLNMFGDADNDKLMNILDCRPFDKRHQGAMDTVKGFFKKKEVDTPVGELQTYNTMTPLDETVEPAEVEVLDSSMPLAPGQQAIPTFVEKKEDVFSQAVDKGKELGLQALQKTGTASLAVAKAPFQAVGAVAKLGVGEVKDAWKRREERKGIRQEAYKEAAKTAGQLDAEKTYRDEMRKKLEGLYPKVKDIHGEYSRDKLVYDPVAKAYVRTKPRKGVSARAAQPKTSERLAAQAFSMGQSVQGMMGMSGGGQGVYESVQGIGRGSFDSKVASLIQGGEVPVEQMPQQMPQQVPQQVPQQMPPQQMSPQQVPQQSGVYSPYSGRTVGYTRGPYKKRVAQYPQQQY